MSAGLNPWVQTIHFSSTFFNHAPPNLITINMYRYCTALSLNWRTKHAPPPPSVYQLVYIHLITRRVWADIRVCLTWGKSWTNPGCLSLCLHKLIATSVECWNLTASCSVICACFEMLCKSRFAPPVLVSFSLQPECVGPSPPPSRWAASTLGPELWKASSPYFTNYNKQKNSTLKSTANIKWSNVPKWQRRINRKFINPVVDHNFPRYLNHS